MSIKTKTLTAAALAALAVPAAALADGSERSAAAHKKNSERKAQKTTPKAKAFTIQGVDIAGLVVTDGKLGAPVTIDPTAANAHARKALGLSKTELKGEDTVAFGKADDAVLIRYVGLQSTDTVQPTDRLKAIGKVSRDGKTIDIRKITVTRETDENESEAAKTEQGSDERR